MPTEPFASVQRIAETFTVPRVQSQLLSELAQQQMTMGQFDAALKTFAAIPDVQERRVALLVSDFQSFPPEKAEPLVELLESNPQTFFLTGRIAETMLTMRNENSAWKIIEIADEPFEIEQERYNFLEKALPLLNISAENTDGWADEWTKVARLYRMFEPGMYQDWALFAMVKKLAQAERFEHVERYADLLVLPPRKSWTYWEVSQLVPPEKSSLYFDKAVEIVESINILPDEQEAMESLAAQLRIYGRAARLRNEEQGTRLLERCEAVTAVLKMPMQQYKLRIFLGTVLLELQMLASIQEYIPIEETLQSLPSAMDRSQVSVWLAEAGWEEGWTRALDALSVSERGTTESERAHRIAEVLKRFVAHRQASSRTALLPSGDAVEDAVRLSGESFETIYFNPFTEPDCGCY